MKNISLYDCFFADAMAAIKVLKLAVLRVVRLNSEWLTPIPCPSCDPISISPYNDTTRC
jgi:hypothetical protein